MRFSQRQKYDKGMRVKDDSYKHKGTLEKNYKEIMGEERKMPSAKSALFALTPTDAGERFVKGLKKKGVDVKKIREDILKEKMKTTEFRIGKDKGKDADGDDKYRVYKKGGRVKKKNTKRMNRLEELGRVDAEKAYTKKGKRNLKAEKKRVVRELKSNGGSAGAAIRGKGCEIR